jgi:hypothetical protein
VWKPGSTLGEELLERFYSGRGTVEEVLLWGEELLKRFSSGRGTVEEVLLWERELLKRFYSGRGTVEEVLPCERNCWRGFIGGVVKGVLLQERGIVEEIFNLGSVKEFCSEGGSMEGSPVGEDC